MQTSDHHYAGFGVRTVAALIDTVLLMLITTPLLMGIYGDAYFTEAASFWGAGPAEFVISWVLPAALVVGFWIAKQATPGKMLMGCKIVDARTGQPASAGQLLVRYLGYVVAALPLGVGIFWVAFDPRKQGWHDKLAGTVVVKKQR